MKKQKLDMQSAKSKKINYYLLNNYKKITQIKFCEIINDQRINEKMTKYKK